MHVAEEEGETMAPPILIAIKTVNVIVSTAKEASEESDSRECLNVVVLTGTLSLNSLTQSVTMH